VFPYVWLPPPRWRRFDVEFFAGDQLFIPPLARFRDPSDMVFSAMVKVGLILHCGRQVGD
jgi:hypothetical protein